VDLSGDHIHVWVANLDVSPEFLEHLRSTLSPEELERASHFYFLRDRARFAAGRGILRHLLGSYLRVAPERLSFCYNEYGKPALSGQHGTALRFNLSHSDSMALVAVTPERDLGVDVEQYSQSKGEEAVAEKYFSPRELACFRAAPEELRARVFLNCWTRKEAYIKARGMGLSIPLDSFDVSFAAGEPAALLRTAELDDTYNWQIQDLMLGENYFGALAAFGRGWTVELRRWQGLEDQCCRPTFLQDDWSGRSQPTQKLCDSARFGERL
jgi:4'-phosphopantetheinyl transferase